ncbi:exocyst complex component exo84 [Coemansia sp. RSA 2711]|nr:exocyst complex component exo84 [Coemansia sp. RSA 2711]KAJ2738669.1 exocyst complex component exo84 [Coemansia sp. Cherry 401B]
MSSTMRRKSLRRVPGPRPEPAASDVPAVSLGRLTKADFRADEYLKETLRSAETTNIRQFRKGLEDARKGASKNLQKNVYRNYESFVFISKEISSMERDMQLLRELLHGINEMGDELMEPEPDEASRVGRRRTQRMSMANQHDMFKDQLARLWRTVRESQRLVPFAPGRHVVGEARSVSELSPSTLQTRQKVDIVVLSDMVLVAARKRGGGAQTVLVADRAFELANVSVADVGDAARSGFLVKIVNRAETFLFGFKGGDAKNEFLLLISHAKAGVFADTGAPPPLPLAAARSEREDDGGAGEEQQRQLDALDIHIARREFDAATELVLRLQGRGVKAADAQAAALARLVLADLLMPCAGRAQVAQNVGLLHRLGWDKEAKGAFLAARSATIRNRTRQLRLEGNTQLYIRELAIVYFRLIRNTCDWYAELFADPTMISALIAWVRGEMAGYAVIFRRHVFHAMQRFQVVASCLNHTLAEVDILGHAGLDLKFMLDQEFFPDLTACVRSYEARSVALLTKAAGEDSLAVASKVSTENYAAAAAQFGAQIPIVATVSRLDEALAEFGDELRFIVRDSLYSQVVASVLAIIEGVLKQFLTVLRRPRAAGAAAYGQELALLVSTQAVISWVIPRAAAHLDRIFGRTVSDIHNLEQRLEAFPASLQDVFCQKHSVAIAKRTFDFVTADFVIGREVTDEMQPSEQMERLLGEVGELARALDRWGSVSKRGVLSGLIDCLFVQMIDPRNWEADGRKRQFSHYGVHRLVLDIHFLLRVCGSLVSKSTNNMANRVCEKALRAYFAGAQGEGAGMMNKSWYDARVLTAMHRLGFSFPDFGRGFEHRSQQSFDAAATPTPNAGRQAATSPGSSASN